jgi:two-component system response regulator YesN
MNLLNGYVQENFDDLMKRYDIDLDGKNIVVTAAVIEEKDKFNTQESAVFKKTIENILANICAEIKKTEFVFLEKGKIAFVMSFLNLSSEAQIASKVVNNLCEIENAVKRFLNIGMSFGVSNICPSYTNIKFYYEEAISALEDGYYKGSNYIVQKNELNKKCEEQKIVRLSAADEKNIVLLVRNLKKLELSKYIDDIFKNIKDNRCSFNSVKMISVELTNIFERIVKEAGVSTNDIYSKNINLYEEASKFRSIDELSKWFKGMYDSLLTALEANQIKGDYSITIKKAIEFILKNYNKDISLSDVSNEVDVSPQYLSKLFKNITRENFIDYLTNIRIQKAIQLLADTKYKVYDVGSMIGYKNLKHFYKISKENTGVTPSEYRNRMLP